jgi:hypothetical protein
MELKCKIKAGATAVHARSLGAKAPRDDAFLRKAFEGG